MVDYPPENLLYGPYAMSLDEAAIQDYAKQLLPDNLQVCMDVYRYVQSPNPLPRRLRDWVSGWLEGDTGM